MYLLQQIQPQPPSLFFTVPLKENEPKENPNPASKTKVVSKENNENIPYELYKIPKFKFNGM
ncbi:hypothetical protein [Spiroplasma poulsonii]|uniref:hypothetical protein n=1 Tax=Spiroplasma poulsonii TaxID=2138 RepID=UPI001F4CACE8|nr:hypothetical protein [Spiroplasma poulsonii]UNF62753.1 hypothetical protein MNU24_08570 [Spiroplasma poulsonii]